MIDVEKLIAAAQSLEPLPASAVRLAKVVNDPESSVDDVADIVAYDQALAMTVLRMANSVASGSWTRITDVREAVMRLGGARVLSAAIGAHARPLMSRALRSFGLDENELWRHSVRSALAVELMPKVWRRAVPPPTFAAALLHDVGKLVMDRFLAPEDLAMIRRAREEGHVDARTAEQEILDVNHAEVGGLVAQSWSLPEEIVRGIIFHHQPELVADPVTDRVYIANIIAHYPASAAAEGEEPDGEAAGDEAPAPAFPELDAEVRERLDLGDDDTMLRDLAEAVEAHFEERFAAYLEA